MNHHFLLAEGEVQPQAPGGGMMQMLLFMAVILGIWWFLVISPQRKADKARRAKLDAIQKGDRVRTRGGIEGIVARVQDDTVVVKIDTEGKVHVPFAKAFIDEVLGDESAPATKDTK